MSHEDREWNLGLIGGLAVTVTPGVIWGFMIVWLLAAWLTVVVFGVHVGFALFAGFVMAAIHGVSELLHQLGHAIAAQRTGYPMVGIRFGTLLFFATSIYPDDEPALPGRVHIRRALGGPAMSISIGLLAAGALLFGEASADLGRLFTQFFCLAVCCCWASALFCRWASPTAAPSTTIGGIHDRVSKTVRN